MSQLLAEAMQELQWAEEQLSQAGKTLLHRNGSRFPTIGQPKLWWVPAANASRPALPQVAPRNDTSALTGGQAGKAAKAAERPARPVFFAGVSEGGERRGSRRLLDLQTEEHEQLPDFWGNWSLYKHGHWSEQRNTSLPPSTTASPGDVKLFSGYLSLSMVGIVAISALVTCIVTLLVRSLCVYVLARRRKLQAAARSAAERDKPQTFALPPSALHHSALPPAAPEALQTCPPSCPHSDYI